jgi:hypothetical protein
MNSNPGTLPDDWEEISPQAILWRGILLRVNDYNKGGGRKLDANQPTD